ncbi:hypothetical protein BY996DRAFT_6428283 [Phakopsora pachyrhizi]|nr:hypothetical protein BY996DRAFT_6428283 [Phakopsora pachyrhizi]
MSPAVNPITPGAWPVAHDESRRNSSSRKTEAQSTSSKNQPQEYISHQGESNVRADLLTSPKLTRSTNSAPGANFALRAAIPFAGTLPPSWLPDFRTFESSGSNKGFASPNQEPHTNETTPSPDSLTKTFVHSSHERSFKSRAGKEWNVEGSSFGQISEHSTAPHLSRPESSTKHMGQDSVYSAAQRQILCSPPRCNTAQSIIIQQSGIRSVVPCGSRASTFETAMASNCSNNSGLESIVESTSSPNLAEKKFLANRFN